NARFLVIGDGELRAELEREADELGVSHRVRFLGFRRDIPTLLACTDIIVMSSVPSCESSPMALLEAMAMERPVVSTDVGSIKEMVSENVSGFLVPPRDVGALAARVLFLLRNPDVSLELGEAGRKIIEDQYNLKENVRRLEDVFTRVANHRIPQPSPAVDG
ncbi:glycosyltransferase, partial [Chloroflexota bacterium]